MRKTHLKGFLIAIIGFMLLITAMSLIMPSKVVVSNTEIINAPNKKIIPYLANLEEWKKWHPTFMDSTLQFQFSRTGNLPVVIWQADQKQHSLRMLESTDQHIKFEFIREGKNPVVNIISLSPMTEAGGNQISWDALTKLKWYPWEKFSGIFINDISGPGYQLALKNLKQLVQPKY